MTTIDNARIALAAAVAQGNPHGPRSAAFDYELDQLDDAAMALACELERARGRKAVAQIACEYALNHPADGFDAETLQTILSEARAAGVGSLYVDSLAEALS